MEYLEGAVGSNLPQTTKSDKKAKKSQKSQKGVSDNGYPLEV